MKIDVLVKTKSKKEFVEKLKEGVFCVRTHVPPVDGAANERIIELLSDFLSVPKSKIQIVSGHKSKRKILEILP